MHQLPVQHAAIQITSETGESRYASVSGSVEFRVRWLLRNFSILDFPVLSKKEQQLIAQLWQAGTSAKSATLDVIGSIEGFPKKLCQPWPPQPQDRELPVRSRKLEIEMVEVEAHAKPVPAVESERASVGRVSGRKAIWAVAGVSLLGCAIYLGPNLRITHPHFRGVAVRSSDASPSDPALVKSAKPVVRPTSLAKETSSSVPGHFPSAMAAPADLTAPEARAEMRPKKPEVTIRVSVDSAGKAESWSVMQGDKSRTPAALAAAKHWRFQPCPNPEGCEHLLKFTEHGDVSVLQMID